MVDITIFELHLGDVAVELPWTDENDDLAASTGQSEDSGGLPVLPLALVGLVGIAVAGVALVALRRRGNGDTEPEPLD